MSLEYGKSPAHFCGAPFRPHRLAWPRTLAFQASNTGSNPVGDTNPTFLSSYPTCRFSLFISLSLSCELDTLLAVVGSLLLAGYEKALWARETGGTSEMRRVRGPMLEVFGTSNSEPRTTDRAFLACLARYAPWCVAWRS